MEIIKFLEYDQVPTKSTDNIAFTVPERNAYMAVVDKNLFYSNKKIEDRFWVEIPKELVRPQFDFNCINKKYGTVKQNWVDLNIRSLNQQVVRPGQIVLIGYKPQNKLSRWFETFKKKLHFKVTCEVGWHE